MSTSEAPPSPFAILHALLVKSVLLRSKAHREPPLGHSWKVIEQKTISDRRDGPSRAVRVESLSGLAFFG